MGLARQPEVIAGAASPRSGKGGFGLGERFIGCEQGGDVGHLKKGANSVIQSHEYDAPASLLGGDEGPDQCAYPGGIHVGHGGEIEDLNACWLQAHRILEFEDVIDRERAPEEQDLFTATAAPETFDHKCG